VFADSLTELLFYDATMHQRIVSHPHGRMGKSCGSGGIVDGRNKLAEVMCDESAADWLFMVDSDMAFPPDIVERLIDAAHAKDRPVVGALAFAHKTDGAATLGGVRYRCIPTIYDFAESGDAVGFVPRLDYERDALVESAATGGACVLIHRLALEAVRAKFGDVWFDTIRHPKGAHFSEDLSFCVRLAACDIPIYVHTGVKTGHDKGGVFYDEAHYDRQRSATSKG
jgi:GT2 family glycosyltransferase